MDAPVLPKQVQCVVGTIFVLKLSMLSQVLSFTTFLKYKLDKFSKTLAGHLKSAGGPYAAIQFGYGLFSPSNEEINVSSVRIAGVWGVEPPTSSCRPPTSAQNSTP